MSYQTHNSNPEDAPDLVPTCRFMDSCNHLFISGGCDSCDYKNPDLLCDEDGEPIRVSDYPERH